jgi:hypothetical protein
MYVCRVNTKVRLVGFHPLLFFYQKALAYRIFCVLVKDWLILVPLSRTPNRERISQVNDKDKAVFALVIRRYDIRHNDASHYDTPHNDT